MTAATLPATTITTIDAPPQQSAPLDDTRLLIAAESFRGPPEPLVITGPRDLGRYLERSGVGIPAYDAIDVALREGVPQVYFARIVGPDAAGASLAAAGPTSGTSLTITAHEVGEWANGAAGGLTVEFVNGPAGASERIAIIRRVTPEGEVGRTTPETTRAALATAIERIGAVTVGNQTRKAFDVTLGVNTGLPLVAAAANFAGGDSDSASVTDDEMTAALESVLKAEGPMQVVTPGRTTDESIEALAAYLAEYDRTGLAEQADDLSVGTIEASCAALRASLGTDAEGQGRLIGMWAQHATGPGVTPGTTRTVPWTIIQAGLIARLQRAEGHPNVAPFEDFGVPRWATGVTRTFSAADAETLFGAGCNIVKLYRGNPRNATFRTLEVDGSSEWVDLAHTRIERAIRAQAADVGRGMGSRVINADTLARFGTLLRARLEAMWTVGALFGATPDEAYVVDTDSVNDVTSMAAREVNVAVGFKASEHAEQVRITLAKVPLGQAV